MQITFTKPYRFAENGHFMTEFLAGETYEVSGSCADSAVQSGVAVIQGEEIKIKPLSPKTAVKPKPGRK